jgi:hypothetical protein
MAAALARTGRPTAGWVTCAVTGVLISPISWDNHWIGSCHCSRCCFVPHGPVGFDVRRHPMSEILHLHGIQLVGRNLFVLGALPCSCSW